MPNLPDWAWFVLEILFVPIVSMLFEHKFSIIQRLQRFVYYLKNEKSAIDLTLWVESDKEFNDFKRTIKKSFSNKISRIKSDKDAIFEFKTSNYDIVLKRHNNGIYIFETDRIRAGIRNIKSDFKEIIYVIYNDKFTEDYKVKNISLNIYLPYNWKFIKPLAPKGYKIKDYEVKLENSDYKSIVNLKVERVNLSNNHIEQIIENFNDLIKIF
jgi:hypothetical protein